AAALRGYERKVSLPPLLEACKAGRVSLGSREMSPQATEGGLHLPPLDPVRGVFEDDIAGFELVADFVGGGPVLVLSGLVALFDQGFDFGVEGIGLLLVEEAEDTGELVVEA